MNCPNCNHENKDDALFCDLCGKSLKTQASNLCQSCNTENSNGAKFCSKCGFSLETSQESKGKIGKKRVKLDTERDKKPKKKRSLWTSIAILILLVVVHGAASQGSHPASTSNSNIIYTQNPSDVVLKISDMPQGWRTTSNSNGNPVLPLIGNDHAESNFNMIDGMSVDVVYCSVTKYPSIKDAESQYQTMYNTASSTASLGHPNVGDEACESNTQIGFQNLDNILFRKGNFIVRFKCVGTNAIDFANTVNGKITN